jgi:hypothetical protein
MARVRKKPPRKAKPKAKRRPGHPTAEESKAIEALKDRWIEVFAGSGWRRACDEVGVAISMPTYWRQHDDAFRAKYEAAREAVADMLEARLDDVAFGRAEGTGPAVTAAIFRIKGMRPEYRDGVRIGFRTGKGGQPEPGDKERGLLLLELWRQETEGDGT